MIKDAIQIYSKCFSLTVLESETQIIAYSDSAKLAKLVYNKGEKGINYLTNSTENKHGYKYGFCRSGDILLACFDNIKIHK